jgi:adenosylmethionine-8-amino-7-oxononanoate aminotransferase
MVGFGRTGKLFGFQPYDIVPDIVTAGKGLLTPALLPLSMMACTRKHIMDSFEDKSLG